MKYIKTKGYKYILVEDERVTVEIDGFIFHKYITLDQGEMIVREGYAWDGSSVPLKKYVKWIWNADKHCKIASLIHDALCQLMREGKLEKSYKAYIDGLYRDMCIQGGMSKFQATVRYRCLRMSRNWGITKRKNPRDKIYTA